MFTGFSEKSAEFLWGIRFNNSRAWFLENKQSYLQYVQKPLSELANEVHAYLMEKHKLDIGCHVTRIYRDARRVRYGGLYKDSLWFSLHKFDGEGEWSAKPVFYFEISPEGYVYGLGYGFGPAAIMQRFRDELDRSPEPFVRIGKQLRKQSVFTLSGEEYKKKKGEKEGLIADWYNRKNIDMNAQRAGHAELFSPDFSRSLCADFDLLVPLYKYFNSQRD